jgi:hypothetical protein
MAQTYTLEEAADKVNLSVEEFKRRLRTEWTQIRSFRDGATLRFRANEIDELARSYGLGSSDEIPVSGSSELDYPTQAPASDAPLQLDDSDEAFTLAPEGGSSKRTRAGAAKPDSDVRLEKSDPKRTAGGDEESILTEELDVPGAGGSGKLSGKSGKLSSTQLKSGDSGRIAGGSGKAAGDSGRQSGGSGKQSGGSGKQAAAGSSGKARKPDDSSSEFELSLDQDSDEFELSLAPDSSEEVALGEMPPEAGSGSKKSGNSGINLNRPTDSGVSLEKKKPAKADDDEIDFELSLDAPGSGTSAKKLSSGKLKADSDSEFELTLEEPSGETAAAPGGDKKGDIFEATDFEIPALEDESASEAVSLDEADTDLESSDFDLALDDADAAAEDESASEVVALDDAPRKKGRKRKAVDDDDAVDLGDVDLEEGPSASKALRGVRRDEGEDEDEDDYEVSEAADEDRRVVAGPTRWGPLPAILMAPTVLIMFLGALMAFEMLHSTWGQQQAAQPSTPLVNWFGSILGMAPAK